MYCFIKDDIIKENDQIVPWWSFGKVVLASAIMKLVEQKKLDLNKSYLEVPGTLKQLLKHEAGQPDYYGSREYQEAVEENREPWSFDELVEITQTQDLLFEPGESWMYSNIGYYHLRRLLEVTMGCNLQEALNQLIFRPLGIAEVVVASNPEDLVKCVHVKEGYQPKWLYHGMLIGTLENACKILHGLGNGKIISQKYLLKMREAYKLPFDIGDRPWKEPSYGLGLMIDQYDGSFGHTGMGPKSIIAVYYYPEPNVTVAVSRETEDQGEVEYEVERIAKEII